VGLARLVLLLSAWFRDGQHTLKITVEQNSEAVFLKLEGRVAGAWAVELRRAWLALEPPVLGKRVVLDLCGVTYLDAEGKRVLRSIHNQTNASFETNSPLTDYFAEEAIQQTEPNAPEEN
jgi:hypothetical protein